MISLSFYLSPERTTMSLLGKFIDEVTACGVSFDKLKFAGLSGHMAALGLVPLEALTLLDVLEDFGVTVTNMRSDDYGDFKDAFGRNFAMTPKRIRAFIVMGGRIKED